MRVKFQTWMAESAVASVVLFASAELTGGEWHNRVAAAALVLTFCHGQVTDRMIEAQERSPEQVECFRMANRYWVGKEMLWVVTFALAGLWTAIVGCGVFLVYPAWRRWYRRRWPHDRPKFDLTINPLETDCCERPDARRLVQEVHDAERRIAKAKGPSIGLEIVTENDD